jgi:hypothetical protein
VVFAAILEFRTWFVPIGGGLPNHGVRAVHELKLKPDNPAGAGQHGHLVNLTKFCQWETKSGLHEQPLRLS